MGSFSSKAARTAKTTVRKYPSRIPPQNSTSRPTNAPSPRPTPENANVPSRHDATMTRDTSAPDAAFNARLAQLGPVQPSHTFSDPSTFNTVVRLPASTPRPQPQAHAQAQQLNSTPSPTSSSFQPSVSSPSQTVFPSPASNPAVMLLAARSRIARLAEEEFESVGKRGALGRSFLDAYTIRQILMLRDEREMGPEDIERMLGLRKGLVGKLGRTGLYGVTAV